MTGRDGKREVSAEGSSRTENDSQSPEALRAGDTLMQMINGFQLSRAMYVAVTLGIAESLAAGSRTAADLAEATQTHAPSLYRLLRALASVGVFAEDDEGRFGLTSLGHLLRPDVPGSVRGWVLLMGGPAGWTSWEDLLHSVRTGESAFRHIHGMSVWEYRKQNPAENAIFNEAMINLSAREVDAIVGAYDFAGIGTLVDVAGGHGALLAGILRANSHMQGVLFDLPHVVKGAPAVLDAAGVADRCRLVAGDMFDGVPTTGDAYILKSIVHDWSDERAVAILGACRACMPPHARLLLAERVIPPGNTPHPGKFMDLHMLAVVEGRERTAAEFRALLAAAGFTVTRIIDTGRPMSIVEAVAR
ncbi:MAG: methyltransferase [Chloroflexota bacterium]